MRVYGIDFTSAPCARKPLAGAMCRFEDGRLMLDALCAFESLDCFENLLGSDGPWVAGMDFPFGLPRDFLEPLNWAADWPGYVAVAGAMPREAFRDLARAVASEREPGQRYSLREVDRLAGAQSPMNVTRPPVGLMFHAGAPTLLASGATIVPVRDGDPQRTVLEAYPRLVAEALIGRRPYKDDRAPIPDTERVAARRALALALGSDALVRHYGFRVEGLDAYVPELCEDTRGDHLDSIMCAVQAAWAWDRRDRGYGIPPHADPAEGWIADPATATA